MSFLIAINLNRSNSTVINLAQKGACTDLRKFLKEKPQHEKYRIINAVDELWRTALHHAAEKGHTICLRLLIKHGANIDCLDIYNMSPLTIAAEKGNVSCLKVLISNKAYPFSNCQEKTPLLSCIQENRYDLFKILYLSEVEQEDPKEVITKALKSSSPKYLNYLIKSNFNIDMRSVQVLGMPPLIFAYHNNKKDHVNILLKCNSLDINDTDTGGRSILHYCVERNDFIFLERILKLKPDVNLTSISGEAPIHLANDHNAIECKEILLKINAIEEEPPFRKIFEKMWQAIHADNSEILEELFPKNPDLKLIIFLKNYALGKGSLKCLDFLNRIFNQMNRD